MSDENGAIPRARPQVVLATLGYDFGTGAYTFTRVRGTGPLTGDCYELLETPGLSGTSAILHRAEGAWWFTAGGGGFTRICKILSNDGSGNYTVQEYQNPRGDAVGDSFTCMEWGSTDVLDENQWVSVTRSRDGTLGFFYPEEACS